MKDIIAILIIFGIPFILVIIAMIYDNKSRLVYSESDEWSEHANNNTIKYKWYVHVYKNRLTASWIIEHGCKSNSEHQTTRYLAALDTAKSMASKHNVQIIGKNLFETL